MKRSLIALTSAATLTLAAFGGAALMSQPADAAAAVAAQQSSTFNIDGSHSGVLFRVTHLGVAPFYGRFNSISGSYDLRAGGSISVDIDVNSVDSNNAARDRHLKSPDFFNVQQFPGATFRSTSIKSSGADTFDVEGDMTIRGITEPVRFTLTKIGEGDRGANFGYRSGFEAEFDISRSDFGMTYLPDGLGDTVTLTVFVEGMRQ